MKWRTQSFIFARMKTGSDTLTDSKRPWWCNPDAQASSMCGLQPKHELLCSKFTLCGLTGKTAGNHVLVSKVIFCFINLHLLGFWWHPESRHVSLRHDTAMKASSSISDCVPSYKLSLGSQRSSKQMGRVRHPGPMEAPKMQMALSQVRESPWLNLNPVALYSSRLGDQ